MSEKVREYTSDDITVAYDVQRCIHAAECVRSLPSVFDPERRPWIDPNNADADAIAAAVERCPTGALHFTRHDQGAAEPTPTENTITVAANGPLYVQGNVEVRDAEGNLLLQDTRVALCRCGATQHKPLCDGSHTECDFEAEGVLAENWLKASDDAPDGTLRVTVMPNGPLMMQGAAELASADGATSHAGNKGALCRCGVSEHKPFCDGSHRGAGFEG